MAHRWRGKCRLAGTRTLRWRVVRVVRVVVIVRVETVVRSLVACILSRRRRRPD
jgi:hypothetical protein